MKIVWNEKKHFIEIVQSEDVGYIMAWYSPLSNKHKWTVKYELEIKWLSGNRNLDSKTKFVHVPRSYIVVYKQTFEVLKL